MDLFHTPLRSVLLASVLTWSIGTHAAALRSSAPLQEIDRRANQATPYSVPSSGGDAAARAAAIQTKRHNFLYGPDPDGSNVFFPSGPLGEAYVSRDLAALQVQINARGPGQAADTAAAGAYVAQHGGLTTLESYNLLYADGLWNSSARGQFDPGMQTNYTQDLVFSMERLTINPFALARLHPHHDPLPFLVEDPLVKKIAGQSLQELHEAGRLFYVDHSIQSTLPRIPGRYAAACEAYFYIHPRSHDFLPLAIKTNVGSDLVYTPLDEPNDWLLAKMAFNQNELWYDGFYHFASTHYKAEVVYMAAIRTLSDDHPVLALIQRIMVEAFAFRPVAAQILFAPGAAVDQLFAYPGHQAALSTAAYYYSGGGDFRANYFERQLLERGLLGCDYGPELQSFPFYEDAAPIQHAHRAFFAAVVDTFYPHPHSLANDAELQAWLAEAAPAHVIDFPSPPLTDKTVLVRLLAHMAYLTSVKHHVLNTNDEIAVNGQLPFHPLALYAPLPTTKGVASVLPFLPGVQAAVGQVSLFAAFARPEFAHSDKDLASMWAAPDLLARMPEAVVDAAATFRQRMLARSAVVAARTFGPDGLSQGMPFVWRALDPQTAPYFFAA